MKLIIYLIAFLLAIFFLILLAASDPNRGVNDTLNTGLIGISIMVGSGIIGLSIIRSKQDKY